VCIVFAYAALLIVASSNYTGLFQMIFDATIVFVAAIVIVLLFLENEDDDSDGPGHEPNDPGSSHDFPLNS
jgi:hypothetical protein